MEPPDLPTKGVMASIEERLQDAVPAPGPFCLVDAFAFSPDNILLSFLQIIMEAQATHI